VEDARVVKCALTAVVIFQVCAPASAEQWTYVGSDTSKSDYYIDQDSISNEATWIEFWSKTDASSDASVSFRESKTLVRVDCKKKRLGAIYGVTYYPNGTNDSFGPYDYPTLTPVVPGTMGERQWKIICNKE
tara:strand:+ start:382 stop:777 length:396 start_codon:yes stop_codon:yes gene_type:complete